MLYNVFLYSQVDKVDPETGLATVIYQREYPAVTAEKALELVIARQVQDAPNLEPAITIANLGFNGVGELAEFHAFSKITRGNTYDKYIPYAVIRDSRIYVPTYTLEVKWNVPRVGGTRRQRQIDNS